MFRSSSGNMHGKMRRWEILYIVGINVSYFGKVAKQNNIKLEKQFVELLLPLALLKRCVLCVLISFEFIFNMKFMELIKFVSFMPQCALTSLWTWTLAQTPHRWVIKGMGENKNMEVNRCMLCFICFSLFCISFDWKIAFLLLFSSICA